MLLIAAELRLEELIVLYIVVDNCSLNYIDSIEL